MIVKENSRSRKVEIEKFKNADTVEVVAWKTNDSGSITAALTIPPSASCTVEREKAVSIIITENIGSPFYLDEFGQLPSNDEKGRLDYIAGEMGKNPDNELIIFVFFPERETASVKLGTIRRFTSHLSGLRKFPINRITFAVGTAEHFSARFQSVPQNVADSYASTFLPIKAERFTEYERLFK